MKKIFATIALVSATALAFAQKSTDKVNVSKGQKIQAEVSLSTEASIMAGMDISNNSSSSIALEVKDISDKVTTISNTLTKVKVEMNGMGRSVNYDSEKPEDKDSQMGKIFADKINTAVDMKIDNTTGKAIEKVEEKKSDESNPMEALMGLFGASSGDDALSSAFIIVPQGKLAGDKWADSIVTKTSKTIRNYTLQSIAGNEATIEVKTMTDGNSDIDVQGTQATVSTNILGTGTIIVDMSTALVKKRTLTTETNGNFSVMGQEMPINAKTTFTATFR